MVRVSSLGAAPDAPTAMQRWHGDAEAHLAASGLAFTHLRPAYFMQSTRIFAPAAGARGAIAVPAGDGRIGMIDLRDVARVAAEILTGPAADGGPHRGATYGLTGPEALSFADVAVELSAATGRPMRYHDAPPRQAREAMVRAGLAPWLADALVEFYRHCAAGGFNLVTDDVRRVTGRGPRDFTGSPARSPRSSAASPPKPSSRGALAFGAPRGLYCAVPPPGVSAAERLTGSGPSGTLRCRAEGPRPGTVANFFVLGQSLDGTVQDDLS